MSARSAISVSGTKKFATLAFAAFAMAVALGCQPPAPELPLTGAAADPSNVQFYQRRVQPILRSNCYRCHGGIFPKGGLRLDSQAAMRRGGKHGSVLTPGHPETSKLITAIRHEGSTDDTKPMPPKSKLSDADIEAVTAWIKAGAIMPQDAR